MTGDRHEQARLDDLAAGDESGDRVADERASGELGDRTVDDGAGGEPGDRAADDGHGARSPSVDNDPADEVRRTVEVGVALLAHLEDGDLPLGEAVDRIETVTTDPALTREILDTAEMRGVIDREEGIVRSRSGSFVRFERDVVRREGEFTCRRCGASLSTGHFIRFDAGEHGPFGSSCIRRVTGRE